MIYLYVKTHNVTGLKYLGKTSSKNPSKYTGSGLYWKLHLKKYGHSHSTVIIKECDTIDEFRYWGEYYSNLWNIVESDDWANLKPEIGDGGSIKGINCGRQHTTETKKKISNSKKGKAAPWASYNRTCEQRQHLRTINTGKKHTTETKEKMRVYREQHPFTHSRSTIERLTQPKSIEHKNNMRIAQQLRRATTSTQWITNGIQNSSILINDDIPIGWYKGRTTNTIPPSQKGKIWINNGVDNTMSYDVPDGWYKGRLKNK
jgi:hypothetical protein